MIDALLGAFQVALDGATRVGWLYARGGRKQSALSLNGHGDRTKDNGSGTPVAPFPGCYKGAAPKAALLLAGIVLIRNIGGGIAPKRESPTVPHEPAGDISPPTLQEPRWRL